MSAKTKQPRRRKHIPQRMCIICREKMDKRDLLRIVNNPEEGLIIDPTGKKNGRGAYVGKQSRCWDGVLNSNKLDQALKVEIPQEAKEALVAEYERTYKTVERAVPSE